MADDLSVMGASPDIIATVRTVSPRVDFEVFEDNWKAVEMFMRLQTQWVITGMGGYVGLNYQSVAFLFKIEGIENQRDMLVDLQIMEVAALGILNSKD